MAAGMEMRIVVISTIFVFYARVLGFFALLCWRSCGGVD